MRICDRQLAAVSMKFCR